MKAPVSRFLAGLLSVALSLAGGGLLSAARPMDVNQLPEPLFADTETTTNMPIRIDCERLNAIILSVACEATASNSLEVLLGCDLNGDGHLAVEESDLTFGYDCGMWFTREASSGRVDLARESRVGVVRRTLTIRRRDVSPDWNLLRVIRRGSSGSAFAASLSVENKRLVIIIE